jgi:hypothetical protein
MIALSKTPRPAAAGVVSPSDSLDVMGERIAWRPAQAGSIGCLLLAVRAGVAGGLDVLATRAGVGGGLEMLVTRAGVAGGLMVGVLAMGFGGVL